MRSTGTVSFGRFTLDRNGHVLREGDHAVHLTPKSYDLLAFLVEHQGELIEKERLLSELWPDVHVSDGSLTRAVAALRAVLGDDPRKPAFIETVPWKGYRFISEVTTEGKASVAAGMLRCEGSLFLLYPGTNLIGRGHECDVVLTGKSVSRRHARIAIDGERATIDDLDSRNGTMVEGTRVEGRTRLNDRAEIRLGAEDAIFMKGPLDERTEEL